MDNQQAGKRLNKYIADSGYCSRREADRLIQEGRVRLDGRVGRWRRFSRRAASPAPSPTR